MGKEFRIRAERIMDQALDMRKRARFAFNLKTVATLALGALGASVSLAAKNVPGAAIAGAGGLMGLVEVNKPSGVFSYLFEARSQFASRGRYSRTT